MPTIEESLHHLSQELEALYEAPEARTIAEWAESADGFIALPNCQPCQISGALAKLLVHKWRTEEQAIMVGTRTALHDNPQLNVRHWPGPAPLRVVIDKQLSIPATHHLLDNTQPTLFYTLKEKEPQNQTEFVSLSAEGNFLDQLLEDLYRRNVQSVLVEGGTVLLEAFLESNNWNEIRILKGPNLLGEGVSAPNMPAMPFTTRLNVGNDELTVYRNHSL